MKRVDVVGFIILLKFELLMEGVWITWIALQGRNKLALHIIIYLVYTKTVDSVFRHSDWLLNH